MATLSYDNADLHRLLAHRHPFLFVDRVDVLEPGRHVVGTKLLSATAWWARGLTLDVSLMQWRRGICRTRAIARLASEAVVATADLTTIVRGSP